MRVDRGAVLINALIVVLAIAAIAAGLLTRSEAARVRLGNAHLAEQLELYLDAAERFVPTLLEQVVREGITEPSQVWAQGRTYDIDRGTVSVAIVDLQSRLNLNWLRREDDFMDEAFRQVFDAAGVRPGIVAEIKDFLSPSGPRGTSYLRRSPAVWPRGETMKALEDLREVEGVEPRVFDALRPLLAALPADQRVNLNTAPKPVKEAILSKLPSELISEIMALREPLDDIGVIRQRLSELLETEDFEAYYLNRMTTTSAWFQATLQAELDGQLARRVVIYEITSNPGQPLRRVYQWTVYD